jgi:hypothetical protein
MDTQKFSKPFLNAARVLVQKGKYTGYTIHGEPKLDFSVESRNFTAVQPVETISPGESKTNRERNTSIVLIQNQKEEILGHCDLQDNQWVGYENVQPVTMQEIEKALSATAGG